MSLDALKEKIEGKQAKIAVIGLGYVGLPVAAEFARVGFEVIGVDVIDERIAKINVGESPIEGNEPGLEDLLAEVTASERLHATSDYQELADSDVILIDVQTPVDENNEPRYVALKAVLQDLRKVLKKGALVIVESTIAPGTMNNLVQPLLEEDGLVLNDDYYLGNCPERVMPGKLLHNLRTLSRVVGGMTPETAEAMVSLYNHVVEGDLDAVDCVTAELVKTAENAYRDVQIAFANEVALICEAVGGDVWKVRELVNKSPGRHMLLPGAGVGGHCIPKDPWLLVYGAKDSEVPLRVIPAARMTNDSMPLHMAELLTDALAEHDLALASARVLVMGYAYLENSDDTRNSPSTDLVKALAESGAEVVIHDPYVPGYQSDLLESAKGCDAAVVMVRHSEYLDLDVELLKAALNYPVLIDGRAVFSQVAGQDDFSYKAVGLG
ncbi:MAG: nucleotide sugar dehydrogenase [Chloroflexi bacterium]|nr:MAG: nucleotide sugar dehydrogenase [Chloroflexota bacterium]MBL1193135.1 nucleotide sugar dehydrogenase [Chloroflexota bacterium]NOH10428.1 nucleotide sugar dehydrogenase [Chloroflexota bacterium]